MCAGAREKNPKAKPMTRDRGSWSGSRYLEAKRSGRLARTEVWWARLTSLVGEQRSEGMRVHGRPYKIALDGAPDAGDLG